MMIYVNCSLSCALFKSFKAFHCSKNNKLDTLTSFTLLPGYCLSARFLPLARLVAGNMKIKKREDKREEKNKLLLVKKRKSP